MDTIIKLTERKVDVVTLEQQDINFTLDASFDLFSRIIISSFMMIVHSSFLLDVRNDVLLLQESHIFHLERRLLSFLLQSLFFSLSSAWFTNNFKGF
jgi:hypothetical protein